MSLLGAPFPLGRRKSPTAPPTSSSGSAGPGAPAKPAAGAAPPAGLLSIAKTLGLDVHAIAIGAWRSASREQLLVLAREAAKVDRDKALAMSLLLAWAAAGSEPEVRPIQAGSLSWLFVAPHGELQEYGRELVRLSPGAARSVLNGLLEALEAHEKAFDEGLKKELQAP